MQQKPDTITAALLKAQAFDRERRALVKRIDAIRATYDARIAPLQERLDQIAEEIVAQAATLQPHQDAPAEPDIDAAP